jgi:tetratricopeptide (TPR) repeat protein
VNLPNFYAELKRRNVYKVAIAYAVVAWLLMQIASQIFPFFEIPNWAVRLVVLLLILGFPIALVLAWAFELTPEGIKRTDQIEPGQRSRNRAWIYIVIVAGGISVSLFFVGRYSAPNRAMISGLPQESIAVLPFDNQNRDQNTDYLSDGYVQGRGYISRRTREDLLTAIRYCEKAIEEDPNYALAYAGLSDAYGTLGAYGYIAPIEGRRKAEEAARKALALDENLAEAHAALGSAFVQFAPANFSLGDRELRRAIELSPSFALAHEFLGFSLVRQGRLDESFEECLKARELDPLSSIIARVATLPYYLKRDYARALELLRQANGLGPAFTTTFEIGIYIQNKLSNETLTELEKAQGERKNDSILIYDTGMLYAAQGKRTEALQVIKELEQMSGASLSQAHWIAKIYATLNEKELAFSWLERGLAAGAIGPFYKDEPVWDPIRGDPRFTDLLRRMGIPQ